MKSLHRHFYSKSLGLFIIRLVAGTIFVFHGLQKLSMMHATIGYFGTLGFGAALTWIVALIELLGGISLIFGWWSRYFSALLAIIMTVAIITVTSHMGFASSESPLLLLAVSIAVLFSGCGNYSLCAWNHQRNCKDCKKNGLCACEH